MKKLLLLFSLLFIQFNFLKAQAPFPDSAATWVNAHYTWGPWGPGGMMIKVLSSVSNYCMDGTDTLINSNSYTKLKQCGGAYKGGIRENNSKVYFVPKDSINEFLLYDFNATTGSTVNYYMEMPGSNTIFMTSAVVNNTSTITANGITRKVIHFSGGNGTWIEGIGNSWGLFAETWTNVSGWERELHCMSLNDSTLYQYSQGLLSPSIFGTCDLTLSMNEHYKNNIQFSTFPNPTTGLVQLTSDNKSLSYYEITNILGEIITKYQIIGDKTEIDLSNFDNGIYFVRVVDDKGNFVSKKIIKQ